MATTNDLPPTDDEADRRKNLLDLAKDPTDDNIRNVRAIAERDPSADLRAYARRVLDTLETRHPSPAAQPDVATLVESLERMTYASAIRELVSGTDLVRDRLIRKLVEGADEVLAASRKLSSSTGEERIAFVRELIDRRKKTCGDVLVGLLEETLAIDPPGLLEEMENVATLVVALGERDGKEQVNRLLAYLSHPSWRVRANTIEALEIVADSRAYPFLLERLLDEDNRIRANAIKAVKTLLDRMNDPDKRRSTEAHREIRKALTAMAHSNRPAMQASAAYVLRHLPPTERAVKMLGKLGRSLDLTVRTNARTTLTKYAEKGMKSAREALLQLPEVPDRMDRSIIVLEEEIAQFVKAAQELTASFADPDRDRRVAAIELAVDRGGTSTGKVLVERTALESDERVLATIASGLGRLRHRPGLPILQQLLTHPDSRCRANAVEAIGRLDDARALAWLDPLLDDPSARVRANAAVALRRVQGQSVRATLQEMCASDEESVQKSALHAIEEIDDEGQVELLNTLEQSAFPVVRERAMALTTRLDRRSARERRVVRVFLSSTFRDTHAERDHLVGFVFPELRERLELLGLEFFDIDLRWGVPERQAIDNEKTNSWEYCKKWIDGSQPFFVGIIGQRYGWRPGRDEILTERPGESEKQRQERETDRQAFEGMSVTEMEIRHAVLSGRRDRQTLFYFRETEVPATAPIGVYREYVDLEDAPRLMVLKQEITRTGRPVRRYSPTWTGSGFTGMEEFGRMILEDLWSGVLRNVRYVSREAWKSALGHDPDGDPLYTDDSRPIQAEVWMKIVEAAKPAKRDPLDEMREAMDRFGADRLRWFTGRERELDALTRFVAGERPPGGSGLCVVGAVAGQGKTSVIAKLAEILAKRESRDLVITHFVGATEGSASPRAILVRLLAELERGKVLKPDENAKQDPGSLRSRFRDWAATYKEERRVVLLIDAINQMEGAASIDWLPPIVGEGVRIVVSLIDDPGSLAGSHDATMAGLVKALHPTPKSVAVLPLDEKNIRHIVENYLREYCKELEGRDINAIAQSEPARNPLYLLVMLSELRTLGGNEMQKVVPALIRELLARRQTVVSLFDWVLGRLEVFGAEAVRTWCSALALGRDGMESRELVGFLETKLGPEAGRIAHRIERALRRYLARRSGTIDYYHGQIERAVIERYAPDDSAQQALHRELARFFEREACPEGAEKWSGSVRALTEVGHHRREGEMWDELVDLLSDLGYIEARCARGMTYDLVADFAAARAAIPEGREEKRKADERRERARKYAADLIAYSAQFRRSGSSVRKIQGGGLSLPTITSTMPRTDAEIDAVNKAFIENPTRYDRLRDFANFVSSQSHHLVKYASHQGFVVQQAHNSANAGPVASAAERQVGGASMLLETDAGRPPPNLFPACLRTLVGHSGWVTGVSVTPDGALAVSGGDRTIRVWDIASGTSLRTLEGHSSGVTGVSATPDGALAISASNDNTLRVWDIASGNCLRTLEGHSGEVRGVSVTPDGSLAISAGGDKTIRMWDIASGTCLRTLEGHSRVSMTPDGLLAISASNDNTLRLWDVVSGTCLRTLKGHSAGVTGVSMTPDGALAISASNDMTLRVWDIASGTCLRTLKGHSRPVEGVSVTPDGDVAISASMDGTLRVWDVALGICLRILAGHSRLVTGVSVTPDGAGAISTSHDETLRVWDIASGTCLSALVGHSDWVNEVRVTPDGAFAISASVDNTLRVWDIASGTCLLTLEGHRNPVAGLSVTPDGALAISASGDKTLRVWDIASGTCLRTLQGHSGGVTRVSMTPDGALAISASYDHTLRVWDIASGTSLRTLEGHSGGVTRVSVTPDGVLAISASGDKTLRVWDIASGTCLRTLKGHSDIITGVRVTPDGALAISASSDLTLRVWDIASGTCLRTLEGHSGFVYGVSVTPDGALAISVSYDHTLRVWDIASGTCLRTLAGHSAGVTGVSMTPDGALAISVSYDHTLRVWDIATGDCRHLIPFTGPVSTPAVTSTHIVAGGSGGGVHFLRLSHKSAP